jgi:thiamine-monophosphate kinase
MSAQSEFALIEKYFAAPAREALHKHIAHGHHDVALGIGDDCALVNLRGQTAISTDTYTEGIHFFAGTAARAVGHKALAVNLSDCAAMGAKPRFVTLALSLPADAAPTATFLRQFSEGFFSLANQHHVQLIGGDTTRINIIAAKSSGASVSTKTRASASATTRAPLSVTVTVLGELEPKQAFLRSGAKAGDDIWVTGATGFAAAAVQQRLGKLTLSRAAGRLADEALDYPQIPVQFALALHGIAHAAIDVSDGLAQDLGHILQQSNAHAVLNDELTQRCQTALGIKGVDVTLAQQLALHGGDDYQLCFTAAPKHATHIHALAQTYGLDAIKIGEIEPTEQFDRKRALRLARSGKTTAVPLKGFDHFTR